MMIPDELVMYCIVCLLIVVIFCCCFHVIELIKLGFLKRKLTSPHRYSLSAISTQFSDTGTGDSRLSTRRNSAITTTDDLTPPAPMTTSPTANSTGGVAGNFSIITVFTYTSTTGQTAAANEHEQQPLTQQSCQVELEESKEPLEEASSSCHGTENGGDETSGYDNRNLMDLMDDPPNYYTALFPK